MSKLKELRLKCGLSRAAVVRALIQQYNYSTTTETIRRAEEVGIKSVTLANLLSKLYKIPIDQLITDDQKKG